MASKFEDYEKLADRLILPINGKEYTIPEVGAADGIAFTKNIEDPDAPPLDDEKFLRMFLGTAYEEMLADNVPGPAVLRAAMTALADFQKGRPTAEVMWATGGDPKAVTEYLQKMAPNRAARRSTSSAAASTTKRPASGTGTRKAPTKPSKPR